MRTGRRWFAHLLLILLALATVSCSRGSMVSIDGKPAPAFTVEKFSGGNISLDELKGKPVILYWFASW